MARQQPHSVGGHGGVSTFSFLIRIPSPSCHVEASLTLQIKGSGGLKEHASRIPESEAEQLTWVLLHLEGVRTIRELLHSAYRKGASRFGGLRIGGIRPILFTDRYLLRFLKPESILVEGHRIALDEKDSLRLSLYAYEPFETEILKREARPGQVVVDAGANIGYYTLVLARAVGERGRVFAFEPVGSNLRLLETNVELNAYENVTLVQKAVTDRTGLAQIHLSTVCGGDHTLYVAGKHWPSVTVETTSLDDYFRSYPGKIDLVKMDVEGAEGYVLRGMERELDANREMKIITEFWPYGLQKSGIRPQEFLDSLVDSGFELFRVDERSRLLVRSSPRELTRSFTPEFWNYTNLLCLPRGTKPAGPVAEL